MIEKKYIKNMNITIKNNITGLINSIEFKLFEEFIKVNIMVISIALVVIILISIILFKRKIIIIFQ